MKKRFQYCVNPKSSNQFLYLRAIHGHSGENAIDPLLHYNTLLPDDFTEYIYHVGNANELYFITRIPGGTSLKNGRQAVFFITVSTMEDVYGMGKTPCDLTKPRIAPCKNTWKRLQNTVFLVQFEAHPRERSAILPNAVTCSRSLQHTACSLHWSSAKNRTRYVVYKIHKTKTQDHLGNHQAIRKVTAVEQNTTEKFENDKHKESFIQDLRQTEKINKFSKESQDLIADMNNTEFFELCENSSLQQCPDCNAFWKWE